MRTTQKKGDIAVSQAIASFTRLGYDVSIPLTESAPYDLIIDINNRLIRLQVKYTSSLLGEVDLRNIHSNSTGYIVKKYSPNTYDWLYVLKKSGEEYLYLECMANRRSIRANNKNLLLNVINKQSLEK